jgi:hypothetical protein
MNISDFNQQIIPYYSPISAKGGRRRKSRNRLHSKNGRTRRHKRSSTYSKNKRTTRKY